MGEWKMENGFTEFKYVILLLHSPSSILPLTFSISYYFFLGNGMKALVVR